MPFFELFFVSSPVGEGKSGVLELFSGAVMEFREGIIYDNGGERETLLGYRLSCYHSRWIGVVIGLCHRLERVS